MEFGYTLFNNWILIYYKCRRGIVLHTGKDDLGKGSSPDSKLTGNSGERLACGIIGLGMCCL